MPSDFQSIDLRVVSQRFENWEQFVRETPEYSIGLEVMDDSPGHLGHHVHFDHHAGVVREVTMSAAMQAYIAVRQGRLMQKWLQHRCPVPVYVWNADQDVCLAAFILDYHELLERLHAEPLLRWIVQFNNKIDVCGGLYPIDLEEVVRNHFTWVFEPYRQQRMQGKRLGDAGLVKATIREVCNRLEALLLGRAGIAPITAQPEILYNSPHGYIIVDEKGDPHSRLILAAQGYTNLISLVCTRANGRHTYSVIRGSPYDEDVFQVNRLIEAFQAAEDLPERRIWGGSNMAAGSDSELGSSLHWTSLRDIAEPIVKAAWRANMPGARRRARGERYRVLLVGPGSEVTDVHGLLEECGAEVLRALSGSDALGICRAGSPIHAIFCAAATRSDPDYSGLLSAARRSEIIPVILCLPKADGGWSDLLETGVSAILARPLRYSQVRRLLDALPLLAAHQAPRELAVA
jgi:hypothetical protein